MHKKKGTIIMKKINESFLTASEDHLPDAFEKLKIYIEDGADINWTENDMYSALLLACGTNNKNSVQFLLDNGADFKYMNKLGENCLYHATNSSELKPEVIRILLEKDVELNIFTKEKKSLFSRIEKSLDYFLGEGKHDSRREEAFQERYDVLKLFIPFYTKLHPQDQKIFQKYRVKMFFSV